MKLKNIFNAILIILSLNCFGQEKIIRIVPIPKKPEPVIIFDGIKLPSSLMKDFFNENEKLIDSVSIQQDSIFDCYGKLTNLGIVKIYTKDSVNSGAKKILSLTGNWLYKHPLTKLMINNTFVDWNENTYCKLINLKPSDVTFAKVRKRNNCDMILKIKIIE